MALGTFAQSTSPAPHTCPDHYGNEIIGTPVDGNNLGNSAVRFRITSGMNSFSDEAIVVFSQGSPATDGEDVVKFVFGHPSAPQIATSGDGSVLLAINAYGPYTTDISIPIYVNAAMNGNHTITTTGLAGMGLTCFVLEDLTNNTSMALSEGAAFAFQAMANDDENVPRFMLRASAPLVLTPSNASCFGLDDGNATVLVNASPVDIQWVDADGVVMLEQNNVALGGSSIMALEAGTYSVRIIGSGGCGTLEEQFIITEPTELMLDGSTEPTSCAGTEDGLMEVQAIGGIAPYEFLWSNGSTETQLVVPAGVYTVVVTDANGCSLAAQEYEVGMGGGPEAGISVLSSTVPVGTEVSFFNAGDPALDHYWEFGDGEVSYEFEPTHSYATPGEYIVTLAVDDGTCTTTTALAMNVEPTTSIPTIVGARYNAWVSGNVFVLDHEFNNSEPVIVRIMNTAGQLQQQHRYPASPGRITIPTDQLSEGIWLLRVSNGTSARTFSLPVVR